MADTLGLEPSGVIPVQVRLLSWAPNFGTVAQLVEHPVEDRGVGGSIPPGAARYKAHW